MKYVTCFGEIWKLSDAKYRRFLILHMNGLNPELRAYGKLLGVVEMNVSDLSPEGAEDALDRFNAERKRK